MSSSRFERPILDHHGPTFSPTGNGDKLGCWPASCSPALLASLSLDPHKDALSKQKRDSPAVYNDDEKLAKIALECYNKENGTNYELACVVLSKGFKSDGTWVHCNFAAWQPNRDNNGISSRKLFFTEMRGDDIATCTWTVTACIVLEGATTVGCSLCSEVIHPSHGFSQGPKFSFQPTPEQPKPYKDALSSYSHLSSFLPSPYSPPPDFCNPYKYLMSKTPASSIAPPAIPRKEQVANYYRERVLIALEYYNKERGSNYELVDVLVCNCISTATWFHCNFTAKPPNGNLASKLFFGEVNLKTLTATACVILEEGGETVEGCYLCHNSKVIHPIHGFVKGLDENEVCYSNPSKFMRTPLPEDEL